MTDGMLEHSDISRLLWGALATARVGVERRSPTAAVRRWVPRCHARRWVVYGRMLPERVVPITAQIRPSGFGMRCTLPQPTPWRRGGVLEASRTVERVVQQVRCHCAHRRSWQCRNCGC